MHFSATYASLIDRIVSYGTEWANTLRDEAKASHADVENKEWVHSQGHSVLDNATSAQDTHTRRKRPETKHAVYWYANNGRHSQRTE